MRTDALPFVKPPLSRRAPGGLFFFDIFEDDDDVQNVWHNWDQD